MTQGVRAAPFEKREYPRIEASCPIRYQIEPDEEWQDATLLDYSATGIRMTCDDLILKGMP